MNRVRPSLSASLPDVDISAGSIHLGEMIQSVGTTRIMGRPISGAGVGFEVVVLLQPRSALRSYQIGT